MRLSDFATYDINVIKNCEFDCLSKIKDIVNKKALSFLDDMKFYQNIFENKNIVAIITLPEYADRCLSMDVGVAVSTNPKLSFIKIHNNIAAKHIYLPNMIDNSATISSNADISDIGVMIGRNTIIEEHVKIYPGVSVGDGCIVRRGAILGCGNFERCRTKDGYYIDSTHIGKLKIGNYVTINEYVRIDKALFEWDSTIIEDNCFIGRGCDIGHGCKIGKSSTLVTNVSVCGHVTMGHNVKVGSGAVISNRLTLGDNATVTIGSVVTKNVPESQRVSGNFAVPHDDFIKFIKDI